MEATATTNTTAAADGGETTGGTSAGGGISLEELKATFDQINAETREAAVVNAEGKRDNYFAKLAPN